MLPLSQRAFEGIAALMHETCGLWFSESKKPLVSSRLSMRIQKLGLESFDQYLELIAGDDDQGEFQNAVDLLTTNETYFFREPEHFSLLERELASLHQPRVSVWSAACSFGDEVYSAAMIMADLQQSGRLKEDWSVLGTDISDRVLRAAKSGIFPQQRLQHVTHERLKRYCLRGEDESNGLVQIQPRLRERTRFGRLNLTRPIEELGPFDVVFLRNVLIYFNGQMKVEVVDRVLSQLRPNGLFFIGTAEGRVDCRTRLELVGPGAFRKLG
ncbi:MAG: CheR family methyltransferase [Pseudomonadota bacterium]|nr:CheR family methyltransferase [Pseudomonadota bacterium]